MRRAASPTNPEVKTVYWENPKENTKGYEIFAASGGTWIYRPDLTIGESRFQKINY